MGLRVLSFCTTSTRYLYFVHTPRNNKLCMRIYSQGPDGGQKSPLSSKPLTLSSPCLKSLRILIIIKSYTHLSPITRNSRKVPTGNMFQSVATYSQRGRLNLNYGPIQVCSQLLSSWQSHVPRHTNSVPQVC